MTVSLVHAKSLIKPAVGVNYDTSVHLWFDIPRHIAPGDLCIITWCMAAQAATTGIATLDTFFATPVLSTSNAQFDTAEWLRYRASIDDSVSGTPNRFWQHSVSAGLAPDDCTWAGQRFTVSPPQSGRLFQEFLGVLRIYREVDNAGPNNDSFIVANNAGNPDLRSGSTNVLTPFSDLTPLAVGDLVSHSIATPYDSGEVVFTPDADFGGAVWLLQGTHATLAVGDAVWPYSAWTGSDTAVPNGTQIGTFDVARNYSTHNIGLGGGGTPGDACGIGVWAVGAVGLYEP